MGQRHPEEPAQCPGDEAPPTVLSLQLPRAHRAGGDKDPPRPSPNPQTPSTRTRHIALSPPATSGGFPQPQLEMFAQFSEVFSLIALVFTTPCEELLSKQTWGWWKEALRSPGAPQQLDGSCPGSHLSSTPLLFLREAVQQCLLYLRHRHTPSNPKITLSLPQPHPHCRDTDSHGVPWDHRTCGPRGTQTD